MGRTSLQECIALFNLRDGNELRAIRMMEGLSEWETAAEYWEKVNNHEQAKVCRYLAAAIKEGDEYRKSLDKN